MKTPLWLAQAAGIECLNPLMEIERSGQQHPWTEGQMLDSMRSGHQVETVYAQPNGSPMVGFWVGMQGVDEVHLLNIAVHPQWRQQGVARFMLHRLAAWALQQQAQAIWLEVRVSNQRAIEVYRTAGFEEIAVRPRYYPVNMNQREDAIIMQAHPSRLFAREDEA